jgi:CDP-glucose 4,6-dehydratase
MSLNPGKIMVKKIDLDLSFFQGKKVLITGHTGFKGSWLSLILADAGANVAGYALSPKNLSHFNLCSIQDLIKSKTGDIRDLVGLNDFFNEFQPEIVFHLAAQAIVNESYDNPVNTIQTNVLGSVNVLEAVRNSSSVRSLVYITSDKCYENNEWPWGYRENDKLGGHDPYSASKAAAEIIFSSYSNSFFRTNESLSAASARAGNVIGGGDWSAGRIIPDCVRAIEKKISLEIRNPKSTRPWQHVLEPLSGYLTLATHLYKMDIENYGAWNFGPNTNDIYSVENVVNLFYSNIGRNVNFTMNENSNLKKIGHEAGLLQLNCDKAFSKLGWSPRWNTEKAILETASWFDEYLKKEKSMIAISRAQIKEYFDEY